MLRYVEIEYERAIYGGRIKKKVLKNYSFKYKQRRLIETYKETSWKSTEVFTWASLPEKTVVSNKFKALDNYYYEACFTDLSAEDVCPTIHLLQKDCPNVEFKYFISYKILPTTDFTFNEILERESAHDVIKFLREQL